MTRPAPKRPRGRPSKGLDHSLLVRCSAALGALVESTASAQGITTTEAWRRAALYWLAAGAPRHATELADDDE